MQRGLAPFASSEFRRDQLEPERLKAQRDEAERLRAVRQTGLLDTGPEEVFDEITALATGIFQAPVGLFTLVDEARQWFKSVRGLGCQQTTREDSICTYTIRQDSPLVVADLAADDRFKGSALVREGHRIRAYAGVPVRSPEGHRLGSLCVIDFVPRSFTESQVRALRSLAHQVETQLALRREVAEKNVLMRELQASHNRWEAFMNHSPVAAYIKDKQGRLRWYNQRLADMYQITPETWLGKTAHDILPHDKADAIREVDVDVLERGVEATSEIDTDGPSGLPLHWRSSKFAFRDSEGEPFLGAVAVEITDEKQQQAELLELTQRLRTANEKLLRATMLDGLTQVGNRRCFDTRFQLAFDSAVASKGELSLILLDIDHFKRLNDTHGHACGDAVLREIGALLSQSVRGSDLVCRFGGEEFVVVLPDTTDTQATDTATRIAAAVRVHPFAGGRVTVSAGVSSFSGQVRSPLHLIEVADEALYRAKRAGRDRVVNASAPATLRQAATVPDLGFDFDSVNSGCGYVAASA